MNLVPVLKIGVFPEGLQPIIDSELKCYSEEDVMADDQLRRSIRAIITRSNYKVDARLLDVLPSLKVIATSGVGYDGIPVSRAREKGIVVTNTPGVLDSAVCELAIGLLLSLLRQIPTSDTYVRSGGWNDGPYRLTTSLNEKRIGIVGLGRIGRGIAARLMPFDVSIAYCGGRPQDVPYTYFADALELATHVDILIVSCPGGDSTRGLINADVLERLGPEGFLVNVSRGTVVNELDLVEALETGMIRGAASDVFLNEPLTDSRLTQLPNTVLTPHAGSATIETRQVMLRLMLDNVHQVLAGQEGITPVR